MSYRDVTSPADHELALIQACLLERTAPQAKFWPNFSAPPLLLACFVAEGKQKGASVSSASDKIDSGSSESLFAFFQTGANVTCSNPPLVRRRRRRKKRRKREFNQPLNLNLETLNLTLQSSTLNSRTLNP